MVLFNPPRSFPPFRLLIAYSKFPIMLYACRIMLPHAHTLEARWSGISRGILLSRPSLRPAVPLASPSISLSKGSQSQSSLLEV